MINKLFVVAKIFNFYELIKRIVNGDRGYALEGLTMNDLPSWEVRRIIAPNRGS